MNLPMLLRGLPLLGLALVFCTPSQSQEAATPPAQKAKFHIYLLMGQSNMAGRDTSNIPAPLDNPRVLSLNGKGQWILAREPLHPLPGNSKTKAGVGPGIPFALAMLKAEPDVTIGLVPCAVGGTMLKRWVKGGDLYEKAVERAKIAAQSGTIEGVLWHQGESDTRDKTNADTYETRLSTMLGDLRGDLGLPDLPVVVGQLGEFMDSKEFPYADTVRGAIKHIRAVVPGVGYADSTGLKDKGDKLHFSIEAQQEMGARFAKSMLELQNPAPAVIALWSEGQMPGRGAELPEAEKPATDGFHRITNVSNPTLTPFLTPGKATSAPAMIVCPGGAYSHVVVDKEGSEIAEWLNSLGISAFVLKYRVPNNREGALQDIQRALSLCRAHASAWNIDPKRLGVIGFSAGGNLAAKASTLFEQRSYTAIDTTDEQGCRPDFAVLVYPAYLDKDGEISPELNLKTDIAPTLIVHNEDDKRYVLGSKLYDAALEKAKVPHEFKLYRTGGHGYGLHCTGEASAWPQDAAKWLQNIGIG